MSDICLQCVPILTYKGWCELSCWSPGSKLVRRVVHMFKILYFCLEKRLLFFVLKYGGQKPDETRWLCLPDGLVVRVLHKVLLICWDFHYIANIPASRQHSGPKIDSIHWASSAVLTPEVRGETRHRRKKWKFDTIACLNAPATSRQLALWKYSRHIFFLLTVPVRCSRTASWTKDEPFDISTTASQAGGSGFTNKANAALMRAEDEEKIHSRKKKPQPSRPTLHHMTLCPASSGVTATRARPSKTPSTLPLSVRIDRKKKRLYFTVKSGDDGRQRSGRKVCVHDWWERARVRVSARKKSWRG